MKNKNRRAVESDEEQKAELVDASVVEDNVDDWLLVSTTERSKLMSEWILDSKCIFHMCPNKNLFPTYSPIEGEGEVELMGNNSSCKIISTDTIQIWMHDGTIRTLSDVSHVFDLKKNLILGNLESKGCRIAIESSDIKVSLRALILMRG